MPEITLSKSSRAGRWLAAGLFLLIPSGPAIVGGLLVAGCGPYSDYSNVSGVISTTLSGLAFAILGALILTYRPANRIGWLCLWGGFGLSILTPIDLYVMCGHAGHLELPSVAYVAWFGYSFSASLALVPIFILLPLLFPTGRFLSPHWRRLTMGWLALFFVAQIALGLVADLSQMNAVGSTYPVASPFGLSWLPTWWHTVFMWASALTIILLPLVGVASMIVRFRRSRGDERQQIKWLAYFLATVVAVHLAVFELAGGLFYPEIFETTWYELITAVDFVGFPLTIGVAIFKYRLYDIDLIIRRTLLYSLLTALLALIYLGSVVLLQRLFAALGGGQTPVAIVLSTLTIAALFNPLRGRLQEAIDRRFYRQKYDAARTLAAFAVIARDEVDLEPLTEALLGAAQETVQPAHVSLWLRKDWESAAQRTDRSTAGD